MSQLFTWPLADPTPALVDSATAVQDNGGSAVLRDLLVDQPTGDLAMVGGDLQFSTGAQAILQDIQLALGFFEGEWFLDETVGLPWWRLIFVKAPNLDLIRAAFREKILSRRGVKDLLELKLNFNRSTRSLAVSFRVNTDVGELATQRVLSAGVS